MKIKVGDWVKINRHDGTHQVAECIAIVPPNLNAQKFRETLDTGFRYHQMDGSPRDHESYLVALKQSLKGRTRKVYWPRVKDLSPLNTWEEK